MSPQSREAIRHCEAQRRIAYGNSRIVHSVEDKLIKSKKFSLPGRKALASANTQWEVVAVDAGESPIERPKKNNGIITVEKRKGIP